MTKNPNLKAKFFFFLGGGEAGGEREREREREGGGGGLQPKTRKHKKTIGTCFVLMLYIKFQVPGSSGSLVSTQTKGVTDSKGHNSANVLQNSVKSHLNMDPKQSPEFQDPSSSNSLHIVLTRFSYCYKS